MITGKDLLGFLGGEGAGGGWVGDFHIKLVMVLVGYLKRSPPTYQDRVLWTWLGIFFTLKSPAKRSQQLNTTYRNIVGPVFASPSQTIATFRPKILQ